MAPSPAPVESRVSAPADEIDVVIEQMDYLIEHRQSPCTALCCPLCWRYLAIKAVLFQIFS